MSMQKFMHLIEDSLGKTNTIFIIEEKDDQVCVWFDYDQSMVTFRFFITAFGIEFTESESNPF